MFFDIILLNSQHGGRFGIAWLAATRGIRFVTRKQIKELNLLKLCGELQLFIANYSTSPKKRFSLRLSAILVNGVIKIFKEQALILQGEVFSLTSTVHIPSGVGYVADFADTGMFETPPTPIAKIKTKRIRKVVAETPEILQSRAEETIVQLQLPNIEDVLQPTARADEISIREEILKGTESIDDIGLGVRSKKEVEEEMQLLFTKTQEIPIVHSQYPSPVSRPLQNLIEVVAEVHASKDGFGEDLQPRRTSVEHISAHGSIPKQIESDAGRITEHISLIEPVPAIQPVPVEEITLEKEAHPRIILPEVVQATDITPAVENIQTDLLKKAAKASKIRKGERKHLVELQIGEATLRSEQITQKGEKLLFKPFRNKFVRINRCIEFRGQFIPESCKLPIPYKGGLNLSLVNLFWTVEVFENIQIRGLSKSLSTRDSADLRRTGTISAQPSTLESISDTGIRQSVQPIETSEQELALLEIKRQTEDSVKQISIEEPIVPTSTPRKRKRVDDVELQRDFAQPTQIPLDERVVGVSDEITYPDQITVTEHIAVPSQAAAPEAIISQEMEIVVQEQVSSEPILCDRKAMETSLPVDYKIRQQRIIDMVAKWISNMGILTIEHVCEKPINRLNIARAFSDLLTLAANRFLILKTDEDSVELKFIEKGPKLINC